MSKIENTIEYLEKIKHFTDISDIDEFFRHMQGHTKELSLICSVFDIDYQENIDLAIQSLKEKAEREQIWHTESPLQEGLYYVQKDDTNSMYKCNYRNGEWTLNMYPDTKVSIVRWAFIDSFISEGEVEESEGCEYCQNKCNLCIHKDEETDIGDSWENETIIVDWCSHDYEDYCGDFETGFSYCPQCGRKL